MDLKTLCKHYDLDATPAFWNASEIHIREVYNGAGPDDFSKAIRFMLKLRYPNLSAEEAEEKLRKEITEFLSIFKPAFVIHDFDFDISDGTEKKFHEANLRMFANMKKILDMEYPFKKLWLWPIRARWWVRMNAAYNAVEKFGMSAWKD